jgi:hypothetical protein
MREEGKSSSGRHHGPDEQVDWLGRRPKHPAPNSGPVLNSDHSCLPCWYFPFLYRNASKNPAGTVPSPAARTIAPITRRVSCLLTSAPSARYFRSRYWASCCHTSRRAPLLGQSPWERAPGDARGRFPGNRTDHHGSESLTARSQNREVIGDPFQIIRKQRQLLYCDRAVPHV